MLIRDAIAECKVSNDVHEVSNGREASIPPPPRKYAARRARADLLDTRCLNGRAADAEGDQGAPTCATSGRDDDRRVRRNTDENAAANGANSYTLKPANAEQFLRTVLASTNYWLTIHQYPEHHLPSELCRR